MTKSIEKLRDKLKKIKIEYLIIFFAVLAVVVIFLSTFNSSDSSNVGETAFVEAYVTNLENKLSEKLSQIEGAGKVTVIISVKQGITTEIATERKVTNNNGNIVSEEYPVLVSGKPIILSEIYPEICGVIIIAKGANDIKVKVSLMSATQTFLAIESEKIEILTMG